MTHPKKKLSLRAIDQGTVRDVDGLMRRMVRQLERKELGDISDVVVLLKEREGRAQSVRMYHFGSPNIETCHWMLQSGINRVAG